MNANEKRIRTLVLQVMQRQAAIKRMTDAVDTDKQEIQDLMTAEGLTKLDLTDIEKQVQVKDQTKMVYRVAEILHALSTEEAAALVKVGKADAFDKAVRVHPELAQFRETLPNGKSVAICDLKPTK